MRTDFYYESKGAGKIHACRWTPEQPPRGVVQIVHGIAEHIRRYDDFAAFLNSLGYLVVGEDHMGHGESVGSEGIRGYFHGGWFTVAEDCMTLMKLTRQEFPELPYVLFGHSMGSFLARTILCKYPDSGITAAIICGTGWQPRAVLDVGIGVCRAVCRLQGETTPNRPLELMLFSSYNKKVEHPRTHSDWLTRDANIVDEFRADPMCGFAPTGGLVREMLTGIRYIESPENLAAMRKDLPVFFIAGGDDPVGNYGKGVRQTVQAFQNAGMADVKCKIYPLDRHEVLNELNKEEVYRDIAQWLESKL